MDISRRLEQLAIASLAKDDCPDPDRLAAYLLGALTGTEQLSVAAHVRDCPVCSHDVAVCRPPEPRPRTLLARLLPFALAEGRRSSAYSANARQYMAADLTIEMTIAPPAGDNWRITGQVVRAGVGLADRIVTMRAGRRRYQHTTDAQGFFTFEGLPAGSYTLTVADGQIRVQIRALRLSLNDE